MTNLARDLAPQGAATPSLREMANAIRALSMDAVEKANSGHPGMPMGMADAATVLFTKFLKFDPSAPEWPDRDRFVLSAGHGSMLLYSLLYLTGYPEMTVDQLEQFRQLGSRTAGHPEYGHAPGIETTTGPLGQGITTAVGMAIAERLMNARFGDAVCDHYTYAVVGDGCLMEGISQEAIDLAGHLKLSKLIVLWDDNSISIDGSTNLSTSIDQLKRFEASNWFASRVDGLDAAQVEAAIAKAKQSGKPSLIACKTIIGFGAPHKQGSEKTHGSPLGKDEVAAARVQLHWPYPPFVVPDQILAAWRTAGERGKSVHAAWKDRLQSLPESERSHFERMLSGNIPAEVYEKLNAFKAEMVAQKPKLATRKSSEMVLQVINDATDMTIGGSADLTHSNYTITKGMKTVEPGDFSGRYIHYGIREHGMAAAMNGIALHGGFVPYGGTFLVFLDYMRGGVPALGSHGSARDLRSDARFNRRWRRWPHAPAHRASRDPARDAKRPGVPPGGCGRDGGSLRDRARFADNALGDGAVAAKPGDGAPRRVEGKSHRQGRVCSPRYRREAGRNVPRDWLRSRVGGCGG